MLQLASDALDLTGSFSGLLLECFYKRHKRLQLIDRADLQLLPSLYLREGPLSLRMAHALSLHHVAEHCFPSLGLLEQRSLELAGLLFHGSMKVPHPWLYKAF